MNRVKSIFVVLLVAALCISPAFAKDSKAPVEKEWTVAVFLNADNNLDPFGVEDQQEMSKVGSNDFLNIISLIDRERGPACYNYIEKGKIKKVKDMGELDMGDYKLLVEFMKYVTTNYPAKHYVLTIWNHGSGWKNTGKHIVRGISYDDSSNNHITTNQMAVALKEIKTVIGHNVDILNMDACLMQMAEVAYACKDTVDYIVASEETEPGKGTPYDDALKTLTKTSTAEAFAKSWTKAFIGSYNHGSQGYEACTQSAVKVSALPGLFAAMDGYAKAVMSGNYAKEFTAALSQVQKFADADNVDLIHLVTLVKASVKDEAMKTASDKLLAALSAVVIENGSIDATMSNAKGLAVYFPESSYSFSAAYKELDFSKASMWDELLADYFKKATTSKIIADLEKSNTASLKEFILRTNADNAEMNKYIIEAVNFRMHTEGGLTQSLTDEVSVLIKELAAK